LLFKKLQGEMRRFKSDFRHRPASCVRPAPRSSRQGQPEISQTRSVWFTVQIENRPEGTTESFRNFHRRSAT
jgi:hypothetical protein